MFIKVNNGPASSLEAGANRNPICGKPTLNQFTFSFKDKSGDFFFFIYLLTGKELHEK